MGQVLKLKQENFGEIKIQKRSEVFFLNLLWLGYLFSIVLLFVLSFFFIFILLVVDVCYVELKYLQ